jgi:hypothetical protein
MRKSRVLIPAFFLLAANAALASQIFNVTMNTSGASGITGSLDFEFNPGPLVTQPATVHISNFAGGTLLGPPQTAGGVTGGPLPAALSITNSTQFNDYFEAFTFGNSLSFQVSFTGPAVDSPNGLATSTSEFAFSTFSDQNGTIPVLTPDPNGIAASFVVNLNGTVTAAAVSPDVQITPEPGTFWIFSLTMLAAFGGIKLRRLLRG